MAKEKNKEDKNFFVAVSWSCADMKLLLISLFSLCSLVTIFQFFPGFSSSSVITSCFSRVASAQSQPLNLSSPPPPPPPSSQIVHSLRKERLEDDSVVKRSFNPVGSAAYLFIQMGAYQNCLDLNPLIPL